MAKSDVYVMPIKPGTAVPAGGRPGVSQPAFIIRDGADYWIPLAMVQYSPMATDQSGITAVRERMEAAIMNGDVVVAVREPGASKLMATDQSTG
nr:hypothetical protein [Polymorphobacter sp.]